MIITDTSFMLLQHLRAQKPAYAYVLTWNRFIESNFPYDDWLHHNKTRILVGYFGDEPNTQTETFLTGAEIRYIPDVHTKIWLLFDSIGRIIGAYVGSLNCENGKLINTLVRLPPDSARTALRVFLLHWNKATSTTLVAKKKSKLKHTAKKNANRQANSKRQPRKRTKN